MIIWIDGVKGVGKTGTIEKIDDKLEDYQFQYISSDDLWNDFVKYCCRISPFCDINTPQNNKVFLEKLIKTIKAADCMTVKLVFVDMALTTYECREVLLKSVQDRGINIKHIILTADEETVRTRVENDSKEDRDKITTMRELPESMKFLNDNYVDATRINTDNKSIEEVADEIIKLLNAENLIYHEE